MLISQYSSSSTPPLLQPTSTVDTSKSVRTDPEESRAKNPQDTVSLSETGKSLSKNNAAVTNEFSQEELKAKYSFS